MKFYSFVLKILSGNEILISKPGHTSVTNLRKMTGNSPKRNDDGRNDRRTKSRTSIATHFESGAIKINTQRQKLQEELVL